MTAEEFDALSDAKKLEWFKELVEELGKHGVLAVPSLEVRAKWEALITPEENVFNVDDPATRITESNEGAD